jgi:RNase adaptor protein for sRNA GlmZ degradation
MSKPETAVAVDLAPVEVISFGYGHGEVPKAHMTFDVSTHFKDPHVNPELRYLTAADAAVVKAVMNTPGVTGLVACIVGAVMAYRTAPSPAPVTIAIGCVGGRHRSAAIAADVAAKLHVLDVPVTLTHRDISRPVIQR